MIALLRTKLFNIGLAFIATFIYILMPDRLQWLWVYWAIYTAFIAYASSVYACGKTCEELDTKVVFSLTILNDRVLFVGGLTTLIFAFSRGIDNSATMPILFSIVVPIMLKKTVLVQNSNIAVFRAKQLKLGLYKIMPARKGVFYMSLLILIVMAYSYINYNLKNPLPIFVVYHIFVFSMLRCETNIPNYIKKLLLPVGVIGMFIVIMNYYVRVFIGVAGVEATMLQSHTLGLLGHWGIMLLFNISLSLSISQWSINKWNLNYRIN